MTLTNYQWTIERYHQAIDAGIFDDQPVELLNGELILMPPEREAHAYYNDTTADYLRSLLQQRAKVRDGKPITLPNNSEPLPDIAIVQPLGAVYLEHHPHTENIHWLIEFANATLHKDLTEKKAIYAQAGITEYWVVNLQATQLHVFRDCDNNVYNTEQIYTDGLISPLPFPDIQIQIKRLMNP
ncbi:MAG: Uma2 family endonuclease [Moorea sp. SIO2B7]|nr:Uma2 family endonuclease [Moorena sp. SIO2B7]